MQYRLILNATIIDEYNNEDKELQDLATIELDECPRINEYLNFDNILYKVNKVTHSLNFIELRISVSIP